MNICVGLVEWYWQGTTEVVWKEPAPVPLFSTTNAEMNEDFAFLYETLYEVNFHVLNYSKYSTPEHVTFSCNCLSVAHPTSASLGADI